jgi:hypothetical protein
VSQHKEQQGFVTFAINSPETDYLELAYLQCLNIKATQKHNKYAVIVDHDTEKLINEHHRRVFDYVITVPVGLEERTELGTFRYEPQVFKLTPFKETIKLESDLLFTRSIDHWWTAFRLRDVCLSTGAKNFMQVNSAIRKYREITDANDLPDVYNGLMYFRYTRTALDFFDAAQMMMYQWSTVKTSLKKCTEDTPSTDVIYALAALIVGPESVTMPDLDFINFVHMKSGFNGWSDVRSWVDTVMSERDGDVMRINNINQYQPVHYYDKNYATQELIKYYESRCREILAGS